MAYSVDNIIPIILNLTPSGLGYANFASACVFGKQSELKSGVTFDVDTYRDYSTTAELAEDFEETSETYLMASRWFANLPKPQQITVWMWDDVNDSVVEASNKMADEIFRFFHFWDQTVSNTEADVVALADFADANERYHVFGTSSADVVNPAIDTDIASVLAAKGNRFVSVAYQPATSVATDPSQIYAGVQLAAAFYKFRPGGTRTAITGEYQVLPGVIGADLSTTAYNALKAKNVIFFTQIELKGETDNSRVVNSKSMSSFGEFMDDVANLAVLKNFLQVDGYNYIANAGTKRPLDPVGYAGLLSTLEDTCKLFNQNGVLATGLTYDDPITGDETVAPFGYAVLSKPEDVRNLTTAQRRAREYPTTNIVAILARAGHVAEVFVTVE